MENVILQTQSLGLACLQAIAQGIINTIFPKTTRKAGNFHFLIMVSKPMQLCQWSTT